jgi:hypothetical protein
MISKKADYKEQDNVKLRTEKSATWEEEEKGGPGSRKGGRNLCMWLILNCIKHFCWKWAPIMSDI